MTLTIITGKILVTTGWPYTNGLKSEVIDLIDSEAICEPLPDFPTEIQRGTDGLLQNEIPIVCIYEVVGMVLLKI